MQGSCLAMDCDYDYAPVNDTVVVNARKPHMCCECNEVIRKGDKYERNSQLYDGHWSHHCTCLICACIRDDLTCGCYIFGELREQIWEQLGFDYVTGEDQDDEKD